LGLFGGVFAENDSKTQQNLLILFPFIENNLKNSLYKFWH